MGLRQTRWLVILRWVVNGVALVVIVASASMLVWFLVEDQVAERYTSGERPSLFFGVFDGEPFEGEEDIFVIAHNAGDSLVTTRQALRHGADIIEIDVVPLGDDLFAGHSIPLRVVGTRVFRGPRVETVLRASSEADAIALDLKDNSPRYIDRVVALLNSDAAADYEMMVSARDPETLRRLANEAPRAYRILSIGNQEQLDVLRASDDLVDLIDGVGVRHTLLDRESAEWLREQELMITAWTVNDVRRAAELIDLGVAAITTDNLTIIEAIGGPERREVLLSDLMRLDDSS